MIWKQRFFNLPNILTFLRIILAGGIIFYIFGDSLSSKIIAFLFFNIACLTDFYDGYMARKKNLVSNLGKLMDPIADKILIFSCFLAFLQMNLIKGWMVLIIISREIIITGFRFYALSKGRVIAAEKMGKHKLVSQIVAIYTIFISLIIKKINISADLWKILQQYSSVAINLSMWTAVIFTIISGSSYIWRNKDLIEF